MKTKNKLVVILLFILAVAAVKLFFSQERARELIKTESATLGSALIPTPASIKILIGENSNLKEEAEKIAPEDFSKEFQALKDEVDTF